MASASAASVIFIFYPACSHGNGVKVRELSEDFYFWRPGTQWTWDLHRPNALIYSASGRDTGGGGALFLLQYHYDNIASRTRPLYS